MELAHFLKQFNVKDVVDMSRVEKQGTEYFLIPDHLRALRKAIDRKAVYLGVYLGATRGTRFAPSVALLDKLADAPVKKATVNAKAEWLFITGKNILGRSVTTRDKLYPGDAVLILNRHGEALGWGTHEPDPSKREPFILKRQFDIGDFLRRERSRR